MSSRCTATVKADTSQPLTPWDEWDWSSDQFDAVGPFINYLGTMQMKNPWDTYRIVHTIFVVFEDVAIVGVLIKMVQEKPYKLYLLTQYWLETFRFKLLARMAGMRKASPTYHRPWNVSDGDIEQILDVWKSLVVTGDPQDIKQDGFAILLDCDEPAKWPNRCNLVSGPQAG